MDAHSEGEESSVADAMKIIDSDEYTFIEKIDPDDAPEHYRGESVRVAGFPLFVHADNALDGMMLHLGCELADDKRIKFYLNAAVEITIRSFPDRPWTEKENPVLVRLHDAAEAEPMRTVLWPSCASRPSMGFASFRGSLHSRLTSIGLLDEDGCLRVEVKVKLGRREIFDPSRFSPPVGVKERDLTLIVKGKKLRANRKMLAHYSPVFNIMLFGNFKEANQDEIELKGIDYKHFQIFLRIINQREKITTALGGCNLEKMLDLTERFDCEMARYVVGRKYVSTLRRSSKYSLEQAFLAAKTFRLGFLMDYCMSQLDSEESIEIIKGTKEYEEFTVEMKAEVEEKIEWLMRED